MANRRLKTVYENDPRLRPLQDAISSGGAVPTTRLINTTAPITGGGDLSADRTIAISAATTSAQGSVELATSGENAANVAVQGNDARVNVVTTKGDIYAASGVNTPARLAVGASNGQVLEVASGETTGLIYRTHNTTKGDVLGHDGSTHVRVPVGVDGAALTAESTESLGLRYDWMSGFVTPELGWELDGDLDIGSSSVTLTDHNIRQYGTLNLGTGQLTTASGSHPVFTVIYCADLLTSTSGTIIVADVSGITGGVAGGTGAAGGGSGGRGGESGGCIYIYALKITGTGTVICNALVDGVAGSNATAASGTGNGAASTNPSESGILLWSQTSATLGNVYDFNSGSNGGGQSSGTGGSERDGSVTGWNSTVQGAIRDVSALQHFAGFGYTGGQNYREFHMSGAGGGGAGGRNDGGAQGAGGGGASQASPPWPMGTTNQLQDGQAGGGGGAGGSGAGGGAGGGGGTGGLIRARAYSIASGWTFRANGSNGGDGGNGSEFGGGGAGGNGGDGGCVMLETMNETSCTVDVGGGTGGTGGAAGGGGGAAGTDGLDGRTGVSISMRMRVAAA